jgi:hypothetical protein
LRIIQHGVNIISSLMQRRRKLVWVLSIPEGCSSITSIAAAAGNQGEVLQKSWGEGLRA